MTQPAQSYRSYLLRLRCVDNGGRPIWLYSLESPDGSARHEFRTLATLVEFLVRQTPPCGVSCGWREHESQSGHDELLP